MGLRPRRIISTVTVAALLLSLLSADIVQVKHQASMARRASDKPIDVKLWRPSVRAAAMTARSVVPANRTWPTGQTFELSLQGHLDSGSSTSQFLPVSAGATRAAGWAPLGTSGIAIASSTGGSPSGAETALSQADDAQRVRVEVLGGDANAAPTLKISQLGGRSGLQSLDIDLPDNALAGLYGADYASRLRWVQVANPDGAELPSTHAALNGLPVTRLGRQLLRTASSSSYSIFLTALSTGSSVTGTGDFTATPLRPASSWRVSAQTGAFDWEYPMRVPPAAAGPEPSLALSYDSQSVDGETGSTNNQPSAVGDGWSLAGAGSIDRSYTPCTLATSAVQTGDLCWLNDNATVSFAGHSGRLIKDTTSGAWRLESDDNTRIEYLTSGSGDTVGYWKLTTTDGTQYFFGLNTLPGGATTNSAWTVPVCGTASTACSGSGSSIGPFNSQAWRWNLDYVLDVHDNAEALYYSTEAGSYVRTADSSGSPQTLTSYVRGGELARIDYGIRANSTSLGAPSDKAVLTYQDRCEVGVSGEPGTACDSQPASLGGGGTAQYWPDVPWDQLCRSGSNCTVQSPTFWTTKRLASVQAQALISGSYGNVDLWTLTHTFPATGDGGSPALWLAGVSHTGQAGSGSDLALPATTFGGLGMQNRVWPADGYPSLDRFRINNIHTESGAAVSVTYSSTFNNPLQCGTGAGGTPADPATDAMLCYQQWWTPPPAANVPPPVAQEDWFNTYVVMQVATNPGAGQDSDLMSYVYSQPAWRFDTSPMASASQRTWSEFAGFRSVEVRHGDLQYQSVYPVQSTTYTFLQGMDGDPNGPLTAPSSSHRSVSVTANGVAVTDSRWLAGRTLETMLRNGIGGAMVSDTITIPWSSAAKASSTFSYNRIEHNGSTSTTYSGSFTSTARQTGDSSITTITPLATGSTRTVIVSNSYDGTYGRITQSETKTTDVGTSCALTTYADNTSANLLALPKERISLAEPCATASSAPNYPADGLNDTRTSYDGQAYGATPTLGDATRVDTAKTFDGSGLASSVYVTSTYDSLGRVASTTDPLNHLTSYDYTPASSGPLTSETVTNPKLWTTITSYDPSWGSPTSIQDVNHRVSTIQHDSLGRATKDWLISNPYTANPASPSHTYTYNYPAAAAVAATSTTVDGGANVRGSATTMTPFDNTSLVSVSTTSLTAGGTGPASYVLYDGLLRKRQTQAASPAGSGAVLSDSFYNAQGQLATSYAPYWANHAVTGALLQPVSAAQIPSQTFTNYDGAGRSVLQQLYTADPAPGATGPQVTGAQTSWAYPGGDRTDMTPPTGAAITSTFTDSLGRTSELRQFHGALNATTRDQRSSYDRTQYRYDLKGQMTSLTDDAGNAWSWQYDVLGRQTQAVDPDKGTTTSTYNDGGLLKTTTDSRTSFTNADGSVTNTPGVTRDYAYDELNRKTEEHLNSDTGILLASWSYDVVGDGIPDENGQLISSTRYTAGANGPAFTNEITSFDPVSGLPTGTAVVIPQELADAAELQPYAGMLQQLAGTYSTATSYNRDGSVNTQVKPAAGGLEEDNLVSNYDTLGNLTSVHGGTGYAQVITWTGIGQLAQIKKVATTTSTIGYSYDPATGRTTGISEAIESSLPPGTISPGTPVANRTYGYDAAGDVTSKNDTVTGDSQCFTYDYAQRLVEAWSQNASSCQTAPSSSAVGGPAPYWQSYSYDSLGDRTSLTQHSTGGATDASNSYNYASPAVNGSPLPNAVSSVAHSGGATGTDSYSYDAAGNTVTRPGESLSYDAEGRLVRAVSGSSTERDIYDADGTRLLQINNTGTGTADATLYLGDTELHVSLADTRVIGTRTYSVLGQPVAIRVATPGGTYPTNLYWTGLDQQQTAADSIRTNTSTTSAITRRYLDPFGNPRGSPPASWPDQHGYLNAPTDALTSTTHLGARDYDPTLGRFLTVDPVLSPMSPQQNNGYSYAWNNPVTVADPTGLRPAGDKNDTDAGDWGNITSCPSCTNPSPRFSPADGWADVDTKTVMIGYKQRVGRMCHVGLQCYKSYTISLYDLLHPPAQGKNYCGGWSWLCTFVGYNQLRNCMSNPSVGECVGAAIALASDLLIVGGAAKFGVLLAESLLQLGTDSAASIVTLTAAETAGNAGDHIVLGIADEGLESTAAKVGGRTLMNDSNWRQTLMRSVADPSTKFTVSLDGFSGSSTYAQVMGAASRGATPAGKLTEWEMSQLYEGGRLSDTTFMRGGSVVDNPFGP